MAELGPEEDLDVGVGAAAAWRIRDILAAQRSELFGFSVSWLRCPKAPERRPAARVQKLLEGAEDDDHLWIAPECAALFADVLVFEASGSLFQVLGTAPGARP